MSNRLGAICIDGSLSAATGRGACSHHGGVSTWIQNPFSSSTSDSSSSILSSSSEYYKPSSYDYNYDEIFTTDKEGTKISWVKLIILLVVTIGSYLYFNSESQTESSSESQSEQEKLEEVQVLSESEPQPSAEQNIQIDVKPSSKSRESQKVQEHVKEQENNAISVQTTADSNSNMESRISGVALGLIALLIMADSSIGSFLFLICSFFGGKSEYQNIDQFFQIEAAKQHQIIQLVVIVSALLIHMSSATMYLGKFLFIGLLAFFSFTLISSPESYQNDFFNFLNTSQFGQNANYNYGIQFYGVFQGIIALLVLGGSSLGGFLLFISLAISGAVKYELAYAMTMLGASLIISSPNFKKLGSILFVAVLFGSAYSLIINPSIYQNQLSTASTNMTEQIL